MLRFRWLLVISLVCGLLTTIATAWGLSWFEVTTYSSRSVFVTADEPPFYGLRMWPGVTCTKIEMSVKSGIQHQVPVRKPPYWSAAADCPVAAPSQGLPDQRWEYAAGFPFRSLMMHQIARWRPQPLYPERPRLSVESTHSGFVLEKVGPKSAGPRFDRYLPYQPIWRGLIANTLVYSVLFLIPLASFVLSRRVRRIRTGRCVQCRYNLRSNTSARCPECGTLIPTERRQRVGRVISRAMGGLFAIEFGVFVTVITTVTLVFQTRWTAEPRTYWIEELPARWQLQRFDGLGATVVRWQPDHDGMQYHKVRDRLEQHNTTTERQDEFLRRIRPSIVADQERAGSVDPSARPTWVESPPVPFDQRDDVYSTENGAYGWPWRSFRYEWLSHGSSVTDGLHGGIWIANWDNPRSGPPDPVIPAIPIWRGLIANTIVYAIAWIALVFFVRSTWRGVKSMRRRALTRRGTPVRFPRTSP